MSPTKPTAATEGGGRRKARNPRKAARRRRRRDKKAAKTSAKTPAKAPGPKYKPERLLTLLLAPTVSEKATQIADQHSQVVFRVMQDATKPEVKAAVELLFKVDVEAVRIANVKGKAKRFGAYSGRRRHWKKAYVSLKPGQEINFAQEG